MDVIKKREEARLKSAEIQCLSDDPRSNEYGVLLSDQIKFYAENHHLIEPFDERNLKPAGYELSLGDECYLCGVKYMLNDTIPPTSIEIPPFEVVVIKTNEYLRLPRFLIARWNLRVTWAYEGLLWIGAAQVDPGYTGNLFCPIYNLSNRPVVLHKGQRIVLIDFVKTTKFREAASKKYIPRRFIIEEYGCEDLKSALVTDVKDNITRLESEIAAFGDFINVIDSKISWFTIVVVSVVGIIAAARITTTELEYEFFQEDVLLFSVVFLSVSAFLVSIIILWAWPFKSVLIRLQKSDWDGSYEQVMESAQRYFSRGIIFAIITSIIVSISVAFFMSKYENNNAVSIAELKGEVNRLSDIVEDTGAGEINAP